MHNNSFFKSILFLASILLFVSCDKEYSSVGDTLIGANHFDLSKYTSNVLAYNEKITPIQSDNLPINALGIYNDPAFGKTIANFATQLSLTPVDPTIGKNPVIDSVYVDVPYFVDATKTAALSSGGNTYVLDSIYGGSSKIKLSVYESSRDMGAQDGIAQIFYTNQNAEFNAFNIGNRLNDDANTAENDAFFFNPTQHSVTTTDSAGKKTVTYSAPSMRLKLNKDFFMSKIINAPAGSLTTNDVFKNYFKGLYFKVEQSGSEAGSMAMMDFSKGTITIRYKEDTSDTDATRVEKAIVLYMTGNTASLLDQSSTNTAYATATSNPNRVLGDDKLYLKGGEGSMAVIDLFDKKDLIGYDASGNLTGPNGVSDELDVIRKNGWLINEANLVFNVDQSAMANSNDPNRIYLFDLNNRRSIIDYNLDGTSGTTAKNGKVVFDGNINRDPNSTTTPKRALTYKIRITNHIRNLVKYADSTNVKLGVVVTESINIVNSNIWRTPATPAIPQIPYYTLAQPKLLKYRNIEAPRASVMNPLGTILYGSAATVAEDKRLKLEIYYTKPN